MKLPQINLWIFPLSILLQLGVGKTLAATGESAVPPSTKENTDLDVQVLKETLAAGRGHRDEQGVRDQWASTEHLKEKYDIRKPISPKIRALLKSYRLDCAGCDEQEAVAKINSFVKETKRQAEQQARRQSWLERAATLVTLVVLGGIAYLYSLGVVDSGGYIIGGGGASCNGMGQARRLEVEEQRRRAAKKEEEAAQLLAAKAKEAPTWRENEEKEVWTPKQEKQFAKALAAFGGVPPKARYTLIADKVDDKNRQECLMHHKLLQLIAKEQL